MVENILQWGEQFRLWLKYISYGWLGFFAALSVLFVVAPVLDRWFKRSRFALIASLVIIHFFAKTAFVCSFTRPDGRGEQEEVLLSPRMVMMSQEEAKESPISLPTEFSTNGLQLVGIKLDDSSLYMAVAFPSNICEAVQSIDIFGTDELGGNAHWRRMWRFSVWPNTPGVIFVFDREKSEKYGKFFKLFGDADTDGDGHSDAEELYEYETEASTYDFAPDPPMISGDSGVLTDITPATLDMDESGVGPAVHWVKTSSYYAAVSGRYNLICIADDDMTVTINGVSSRGYWDEPSQREIAETNEVHLVQGANPLTIEYTNNGDRANPYHRSYTLEFREADQCPKLIVPQTDFKISPKFSASKLAAVVASASYEDECGEHNCRIGVREMSSGLVNLGNGRVGVSPSWRTNRNRETEMSVTFVLFADEKEIANQTCTFSSLPEDDDDDDECECGEKTTVGNKCVSFSQRFGRTPHIPWLPAGRLVVKETSLSSALFTPTVLKYDHPMMRELVFAAGYDALVRDPLGNIVEYKDGVPANSSGGLTTQFYHDGTNYIERLSRNLEVIYSQGRVAYLRGEQGKRIPVDDLGISVARSSDGAIASITSVADGTMVVSSTGLNAWSILWTSPSGRSVKTFAFSGNGSDVFRLHEVRDNTFTFDYRWTYDNDLNDWRFEQGRGEEVLKRSSKSITYNSVAQSWEVSLSQEDALGNSISCTQSTIDVSSGTPRTTSRMDGDDSLYSATRDTNGYLATETNDKGETTAYTRDRFGRILSERTRYADSFDKETIYRYAFGPKHNVDTRPVEKIVKIGGLTVEHELYRYWDGCIARRRFFGSGYRESFTSYDDFGREILSVQENGRARQTEYTSLDANGGWTETATEGVWKKYALAPVEGKSTRRVRHMSAEGNATNIVEYAYVDGSWHETASRSMTYDVAHRVTSTTYSDGRSSAAEYICTGAVWERDTEGIVTSNEYNSVKALVRSTRIGPHGAVQTSCLYDAAGRVTNEVQCAEGCVTRVRSLGYDSRGRIAWEVGFDGVGITHTYSEHDRVHTKTYSDGSTEITTVNTDGTLASITGTAVVPRYYTYDISPLGEIETTVHYGTPNSAKYETTIRNAYGEIMRKESSGYNGAAIVTRYSYDDHGRLIKETTDGEPEKTYEYDDWGNLISFVETANGASRITEYQDGYCVENDIVYRGRRETLSADGCADVQTASRYEQISDLSLSEQSRQLAIDKYGTCTESVSSVDPLTSTRRIEVASEMVSNRVSQVLVDGNLVESVSESAVTNRFEYNAYGWRTAAIDGRGNRTSYEYDQRGNLIRATDAVGGVVSRGYDTMNRLVAVTNEVGNVTRYEYDAQGRKTYEGGATYPVRYAYDIYGNRVTMTTYRNEASQSGDTTTWVYDVGSGLVIRKVYADGNGPSYTYTPEGKLSSRTWARGIVTNYAYDGWGNLVSTTYSDGTPAITYSYDALGRVTSASDVSGTATYVYDEKGDETEIVQTGLVEKTLSRHYDDYGRNTGYSLDGTRQITVEYDSASGRIASADIGGIAHTWSYLEGSDLKSRLDYGTIGSAEWSYEPNRDLLTQVENSAHGSVISQYDYTNDAAGRRTSKNNERYGYNERGELISATGNGNYSYVYDDIGNRISSSEPENSFAYTANSLNQYTGISAANLNLEPQPFIPQYDLDGNQTLIKTKTGIWSVTYNGENRPIDWTCGATNIVMKYDRMGRRVEYLETVSDLVDATITTNKHQRFVYDNYLCVERLDASNTNAVTDVFVWDPTEPIATRPLFWRRYTGTRCENYFYAHDGNKNVSDIISVDTSTGVANHYIYAPFGEIIYSSMMVSNPWQSASEYYDKTLKLAYYNYRYYNPLVCAWIRRDPISERGGLNLYTFCKNRILVDVLGCGNSCSHIGDFNITEISISINPSERKFDQKQVYKEAESLLYELAKLGIDPVRTRLGDVDKMLDLIEAANDYLSQLNHVYQDDVGNRLHEFTSKYLSQSLYRVDGVLKYQLCECVKGRLLFVDQDAIEEQEEVSFESIYDSEKYRDDINQAIRAVENHLLESLANDVKDRKGR